MNGIPENQTFDFAPNVSQPILTKREKKAAYMKEYAKKRWINRPDAKAKYEKQKKEWYAIPENKKRMNDRVRVRRRTEHDYREKMNDYYSKWEQNNIAKKRYRQTEYRKNFPQKAAAHKSVYDAIEHGRLVKPTNCQICGVRSKLHAHHHDYAAPLDVQWLCPLCHGEMHAGRILINQAFA